MYGQTVPRAGTVELLALGLGTPSTGGSTAESGAGTVRASSAHLTHLTRGGMRVPRG